MNLPDKNGDRVTTKTKPATKAQAAQTKPATVKQPDQNPIWTALVAELGDLPPSVDTEYTVLEARAVMALVEAKPS